MSVDAVTGSSSGMYATEPTREPKKAMDQEVFMNLLVTQLRNQDPSSPMDTNQMISQTTQLAMMEKMTEMASINQENFSLQMRTAAAALLGQEVTYTNAEGKDITGVATAVSYLGPVPQVTVSGEDVALDIISGVKTQPLDDTSSL